MQAIPPNPRGVPPAAKYATGRNKTRQPLRHTKPTELSTTRELSDKSEKNNYRKKQKRRRGVGGTKPRTNKTGAPGGFPMLMGQREPEAFQTKGEKTTTNQTRAPGSYPMF